MRQNAYETQNMSHDNRTPLIDCEPCCPRALAFSLRERFEKHAIYQEMCWGTLQVAAVLVPIQGPRADRKEAVICGRWWC
jgi:hypothetical protein